GDTSYWLFVIGWFLLVTGIGGLGVQALRGYWSWPSTLVVTVALASFVVASMLAHVADTRMGDTFSQFWHDHQKRLRASMKQFHKEAKQSKEADSLTADYLRNFEGRLRV